MTRTVMLREARRPKDLAEIKRDSSLRNASFRMTTLTPVQRKQRKTAGEAPPTLTKSRSLVGSPHIHFMRHLGVPPAGPASLCHPGPRSVRLLTAHVCESTSAEQGQPVCQLYPSISVSVALQLGVTFHNSAQACAVFISYIVSYASKRWCYIARRRKFFARTKCIKKCIEAAARFARRVSEASRFQLQLRSDFPITIAAAVRKVRAP